MKKILIIEDNDEVRENLEEILDLYGYDTTTAENGKVGVEKAITNPPDLILCDIMMPELDGFGTLNILSKKPATADIPFVFLTAKSEKEDFRRGMNLGADDYVTKPFYKDELLQVIETRLKKSERLKKTFDGTPTGLTSFINEARGYEALKKLSDEQTTKSFRKKDQIFAEGDLPRYMYLVNSGKVKLYKTNDYGKEYIIHIAKQGEFFWLYRNGFKTNLMK
ncbi:MAG: response regulator [Saprospiraceae bacterium]